jgi:hypothetical protein
MTQATAAPDAATDPRIDPKVRSFLADVNQDPSPFWELPQPKPQENVTGLQNKTPVDMSGVTTVEKTITQDGRSVKLYVMKPAHVTGKPGVLLFIHGGVWIVGNFENHKRLLRDLVAADLPPELLVAPKRGFSVPLAEWWRGPAREKIRENLADLHPSLRSFMNQTYIATLLDEHQQGRRNHAQRLWCLGVLNAWAWSPAWRSAEP